MHTGGIWMTKKSKSKRFTTQSADAVKKHAERFPYRERLADAVQEKDSL